MRLLVISDIHGSKFYLDKVLKRFNDYEYDYLVILGDILYHGARNPLPEGYNPKEVLKSLNMIKDKIIAIKGNCDSEVDEMVLDFPLLKNSMIINNRRIFLTHGHEFNKDNLPNLSKGDIMLYGHYHIPFIIEKDGIIIANPSSISLPKEGNIPTMMELDDKKIKIIDLSGNTILEKAI